MLIHPKSHPFIPLITMSGAPANEVFWSLYTIQILTHLQQMGCKHDGLFWFNYTSASQEWRESC